MSLISTSCSQTTRVLEFTPQRYLTHIWTTRLCGATSSKVCICANYRSIWLIYVSRIAAWELEQGQSSLEMRRARPQFADLARQAQEHYQSQLAIYEKKKQAYEQAQQDAASADSGEGVYQLCRNLVRCAQRSHYPETVLATRAPTAPPPECPLPPNNLEPYSDDIFGLDKARRDCRFEMIKIVKEVCFGT